MSSPLDGDELRIDDLGFTELLRIALADVPAAAQGRWTLHGPVDPGITLLELFAWQLEQRLFMAEQVTDPTVRASLALLGVPEPAATRAARTVLCLTGPAPGVAAAPVDVPAGTVFTLDGDPRGRRFGTEQAVAVLPVGAFTVTGRMHTPGDTLELAHDYAGPRIAGGRLSLLVDVTAAPGVAPAWSPDAHDVSPAGMLRWTAVGPDGSEAVVAVADGTGGLRRAGLLGVDWPAPWNALGAGPCRLRATLVRGRFTEPVRVRGVHANAVPAAHRVAGRSRSRRRPTSTRAAARPARRGSGARRPGRRAAVRPCRAVAAVRRAAGGGRPAAGPGPRRPPPGARRARRSHGRRAPGRAR